MFSKSFWFKHGSLNFRIYLSLLSMGCCESSQTLFKPLCALNSDCGKMARCDERVFFSLSATSTRVPFPIFSGISTKTFWPP